jgi:hypothetical protein
MVFQMSLNFPKLPLVRFYRRIPLIPGMLWLNVFKWGISLSIGQQGFRLTLGKSNFRGTVGLPGTGLFLTKNMRHSASAPVEEITSSLGKLKSSGTNKKLGNNHGKKNEI